MFYAFLTLLHLTLCIILEITGYQQTASKHENEAYVHEFSIFIEANEILVSTPNNVLNFITLRQAPCVLKLSQHWFSNPYECFFLIIPQLCQTLHDLSSHMTPTETADNWTALCWRFLSQQKGCNNKVIVLFPWIVQYLFWQKLLRCFIKSLPFEYSSLSTGTLLKVWCWTLVR